MPKYVVRYGVMRHLAIMSARDESAYSRGTQVIARTDRGLEAAVVLCEATPQATGDLKNPGQGQVLREMSGADVMERSRILNTQREEFQTCRRHIEQLQLEMELVDVEHIFGGERVVIYYLAENRIDFRELVKLLAADFQTRIEMRQIGVRDEAKLLADYGDCGKPVCCKKICRRSARRCSRKTAANASWPMRFSLASCSSKPKTIVACSSLPATC
jgi:cell fate regulator YaaT (PSP1 superfamily)